MSPSHSAPIPSLGEAEQLTRKIADHSLLPLQGFFVSVFYCFFNGEVRDQPWEAWALGLWTPLHMHEWGCPAFQEHPSPGSAQLCPEKGEGRGRPGKPLSFRGTGIPPEGLEPI